MVRRNRGAGGDQGRAVAAGRAGQNRAGRYRRAQGRRNRENAGQLEIVVGGRPGGQGDRGRWSGPWRSRASRRRPQRVVQDRHLTRFQGEFDACLAVSHGGRSVGDRPDSCPRQWSPGRLHQQGLHIGRRAVDDHQARRQWLKPNAPCGPPDERPHDRRTRRGTRGDRARSFQSHRARRHYAQRRAVARRCRGGRRDHT